MENDWQMQAAASEEIPSDNFTIVQESSPNEYRLDAIEQPRATSDKHLLIIHGWGSKSSDMERWLSALKESGDFSDRYIWNIQYDYSKQFPIGASWVLQSLQNQVQAGHHFRDVIFLCYSMGGLVARQMIAQGFPVTRLVSVCSPHQGMMYGPFFPPVDLGVISLKQGSDELRTLNNDPREASLRNRYMFVAVQYNHKNMLGQTSFHDDDTAVDGWSARGDALGAGVKRCNVCLSYEGGVGVALGAPHKEGMNPAWFGRAIQFLKG